MAPPHVHPAIKPNVRGKKTLLQSVRKSYCCYCPGSDHFSPLPLPVQATTAPLTWATAHHFLPSLPGSSLAAPEPLPCSSQSLPFKNVNLIMSLLCLKHPNGSPYLLGPNLNAMRPYTDPEREVRPSLPS